MMRTIPAAVAALAGALTLTACTGSTPSAAPSLFSPAPPSAVPSVVSSVTPAITIPPTTPAVAQHPTISQARAAYLRIAAPVNRAAAAVNTDLAYGVPFAVTQADDLAYLAALRKSASQLRATTWPAQVQGYVAAMLLTYPAGTACARAVASAGSNSAATDVLSTNQSCAQAQHASDPHQIRMLLHLPSTTGSLPGM